jgi:hypothetical protein
MASGPLEQRKRLAGHWWIVVVDLWKVLFEASDSVLAPWLRILVKKWAGSSSSWELEALIVQAALTIEGGPMAGSIVEAVRPSCFMSIQGA